LENNDITRRGFIEKAGGLVALSAMGSALPWGQLRAADLPKPGPADWPSFAHDRHNTRFNSEENTIGPQNVDKLKLKWKFDTADNWPIHTTPTVIGDTLFFAGGGFYYALDTATGRQKWKMEAGMPSGWVGYENGMIRSSAAYVNGKIYFGTGFCDVFCVDAATGIQVWKTNLEPNKQMRAQMFLSPVVYNGKVMVAWSSGQAGIACLDAETGAVRWRFRIAQDVPPEYLTGGGSAWSSAAIDEKMNVVFNATGSAKGAFANQMKHTESVLAHDLDTGELLWAFQAHQQDTFDLDFCAGPMIVDPVSPPRLRDDVRQCVVAGNKGGIYCLNRHSGQLYWKVMLGAANSGSGPRINAMASAYNKIYVQNTSPGPIPMNVTAALQAFNGDIEWITPNPGPQTAPICVANRVLYQGYDVNTKIDALDAMTGRRLWEYPLPSPFRGGAAVANGALYFSNGVTLDWKGDKEPHKYSLYCFTVDGK
jgi:polyvinyl alcohol dehydrogenase (cytochrome)